MVNNEILKLPKELTVVVNQILGLLGHGIKEEYGLKVYNEVERVRAFYKSVRSSSLDQLSEAHAEAYARLKRRTPKEKNSIAHSFAVSLELINAAENAYRSFRLKQKQGSHLVFNETEVLNASVVFVLTSHPTEARSRECVKLLGDITKEIFYYFQGQREQQEFSDKMYHWILLFLKIPIAKIKSPTVSDEAEYIYSIIFQKQILRKQIDLHRRGCGFYLRTWVGGDKDGHPGVNEKVMLSSLNQSRSYIIKHIKRLTKECLSQLSLLNSSGRAVRSLQNRIKGLESHAKDLGLLRAADGRRIRRLRATLEQVSSMYEAVVGTKSPQLAKIESIVNLYPGLVVPLELREDSSVVKISVRDKNQSISKMLATLRSISSGGNSYWYARGFVLSMCESIEDVENGVKLLKKQLGKVSIPVIPLFETHKALEESCKITQELLNIDDIKQAIKSHWGHRVEIMLGYSDSAKESGALFSRVMIGKTLKSLDHLIKKAGYTPIFFHGSGGSVARGGGSLEEQISWWPQSARLNFKSTIQGEMVYRSFSSPQIIERQIETIKFHQKSIKGSKSIDKAVVSFANQVRIKYQEKVADEEFLNLVKTATPYPYLEHLKIGSRPSKRKAEFSLKSLRAIPWVLCWTQTRALFPVWWGIGSCWRELEVDQKIKLNKAYKESDFFSSFLKTLSYSVSKVDLSVWFFYLDQSGLPEERVKVIKKEFQREFRLVCEFIKDITGEKDLLWFRPWLKESIALRSTMIYPLNILEVDALKNNDIPLLRETVTGVASGMQTTG